MAIPQGVKIFTDELDPYDILDFKINLAALLEGGETISGTPVLALPTESTLLGLEIKTTNGYATSLSSNVIKFYLGVIDAEQNNTAFDGEGVLLPIKVTVTTNSVPPRRKQRTVAVRVKQK